jgi:cobalamin-dependent methionine synthase I
MPIIRGVPVNLDMDRVLQRQGFKDLSKVRPEMRVMASELLAEAQETRLIDSAVTYEVYPVAEMGDEHVTVEGRMIAGTLLPSRLLGAKRLVFMVITIGPKLENRVKEYSASGTALRGMLLDGVGSAAVDAVARECYRMVAEELSGEGAQVSSMMSPGMAGFPLTEQSKVLDLAGAREIGVVLMASGIMVPRKSTSRVVGIGSQMKTPS